MEYKIARAHLRMLGYVKHKYYEDYRLGDIIICYHEAAASWYESSGSGSAAVKLVEHLNSEQ